MDLHKIDLPRKIVIGKDAINLVGETCKDMSLISPAFVLIGPKIFDIAGKSVLKSLKKSGYKTSMKVVDSIKKSDVEKIIKIAKDFKFILGVGGGKTIDIAKYTAFKLNIPFLSVPTAPSHDGIASSRATLNDKNTPYSFEAKPPIAIIADMSIISNAPYRLIVSGCADVISKVTAVADWKLSHEEKGEYFSDSIASMALSSANVVINSANSIKNREINGIKNLVDSLINCSMAMCIARSSRPASGSEHLFSHALDVLYPEKKSLHGEQCGVGCIMSAYLHKLPWEKIRETLKSLGCPINAKELGIPSQIVVKALTTAKNIRLDRYTILNKVNLNEKTAEEVAKATGVI